MQKANKLKCVEIEIWMTKRGGAMIGLIIATHGNSSVELIKGAEMFAGPLSQCKAWTLNPGDDIEKGKCRNINRSESSNDHSVCDRARNADIR